MKLTNATKIGIGWTVCVTISIYAFYLSKESVIQKRYEQMKIREQIRRRALESASTENKVE